MAQTLAGKILDAFRAGDLDATKDALAWAIDRAADRMAEGNRGRLSDFWDSLAAVHYKVEALPLSEELREQRGYLEAIVHLTHAVRDRSDDLEAIQKVRSCAQGPAILGRIREEGTIRHGALAQGLGISAPSLTQAIGALAESRTVTATVHGKFKYYSLTPVGRLVAARLHESPQVLLQNGQPLAEDVLENAVGEETSQLARAGGTASGEVETPAPPRTGK
jgi:hypothetical protein